jgi:hypothetical protein
MKTSRFYNVPREGIGPPTPAFSGPRSTTELPRLVRTIEVYIASSARYDRPPRNQTVSQYGFHRHCEPRRGEAI